MRPCPFRFRRRCELFKKTVCVVLFAVENAACAVLVLGMGTSPAVLTETV